MAPGGLDLQGARLLLRAPLPGTHQLTNTLTALNALAVLRTRGFSISQEAMQQGIALVRWPARLEWAGNVLLDGGHNPQGIAALTDYVQTWLKDTRRVLVTGVLEDHLQPDMLQSLSELGQETITITPDSPRAMQGESWRAASAARQARAVRAGNPRGYAVGAAKGRFGGRCIGGGIAVFGGRCPHRIGIALEVNLCYNRIKSFGLLRPEGAFRSQEVRHGFCA